MKKQLNEVAQLQKIAGILKESYDKGLEDIASSYSNTKPNTPSGATPGNLPNTLETKIDEEYDSDYVEPLTKEAQALLNKLLALAEKGEILPRQIAQMANGLVKARRKYTTSQRDPESYKKAAEKAKATKVKNKADLEKRNAASDKEYAAFQKRKSLGLAPMTYWSNSAYPKKGDSLVKKYYDVVSSEPEGEGITTSYRLKSQYKNTKNIPGVDLFWGNRVS